MDPAQERERLVAGEVADARAGIEEERRAAVEQRRGQVETGGEVLARARPRRAADSARCTRSSASRRNSTETSTAT
jgi:hypothetical protein